MSFYFSKFQVYVDASDGCNDLSVFVGSTPSSGTEWIIKVSQLKCDFINLPPSGCTQWFFDGMDGVVRSYNYAGGLHLAQQNQNICVRYTSFVK